MELHPNKLMISWKYHRSKMHLIHLTCRTHSLAWPTLNVLRTLTLAKTLALILSFLSRVIAYLFSPEVGETDGHFVHMMRYKNSISKKCWQHSTMESIWLPSWLRGRVGAAAHCQRPASWGISHRIPPALEKNRNFKFEVRFPLNVYCFHTIVKSKNPKSELL